jgi:hypothetical protein
MRRHALEQLVQRRAFHLRLLCQAGREAPEAGVGQLGAFHAERPPDLFRPELEDRGGVDLLVGLDRAQGLAAVVVEALVAGELPPHMRGLLARLLVDIGVRRRGLLHPHSPAAEELVRHVAGNNAAHLRLR